MNFKILILLMLVGCGVKGDPISPKSPPLPSLMDHYPDIQTEKPLDEHRKR